MEYLCEMEPWSSLDQTQLSSKEEMQSLKMESPPYNKGYQRAPSLILNTSKTPTIAARSVPDRAEKLIVVENGYISGPAKDQQELKLLQRHTKSAKVADCRLFLLFLCYVFFNPEK